MAIKDWTSIYPAGLDTSTQQPTVLDNVDATRASQVNSLSAAVRALQAQVGSDLLEGTSLRGKAVQTPLPVLTYTSSSSVTAELPPGFVEVRRTLSDGKLRTATSGIVWTTSDLDTGSLTPNDWVKLYLVPDPGDDDLLSIIGSLTPPPTGPTGYTAWEYLGTIPIDQSSLNVDLFDAVGPQFFHRRTVDWREVYSILGATPTFNAWFSASLVNHIPTEVAAAFTVNGILDTDTNIQTLSIQTFNGLPAGSPGNFNGGVFLVGEAANRETNTRTLPIVGGDTNLYLYWTTTGAGNVDAVINAHSWVDKFLLAKLGGTGF